MSTQYSFSEFDPREFEFLCRDLLQKSIAAETGKAFFFNSFSEGPDGGMDALFEDENEKIVLQCKRYFDFKSLYASLKYTELPKVSTINPTRYIIATSCKLSQKELEKIYALFKPYMRSTSDILGYAMINNLLSVYADVALNYPRLYLTNATILNRLLQANVYNQSVDQLKKYRQTARFYVPDGAFQQSLKILNEKRYVIISGEPGVGKSTLAGMLALFYLEQDYEFIFLRRSISEAEGSVWNNDRKQLFLFDDFLGSTFFEGFDRNEDRQLLDFISKIVNSCNKLLLITTREYVFKQAEIAYPELKKLHFTKCIIRQREFTKAFKINVLYNYLYYSAIELKHIEPLLFNDNYKGIIYHNNFTPRLISDYIERYYDKNEDSYSLYFGLKKYLDDPYAYWEAVFLKLSDNAQMLLLIMAITEEPVIEECLLGTFMRVGTYRKIYEKGYEKDSFQRALAELSESFITLSHNPDIKRNNRLTSLDFSLIQNPFRASRFIEFQNPSIKDFAINFLRKREDLISFLLQGATLFNQLHFVFTTLADDTYIDDDEALFGYSANKIVLSGTLSNLLAQKMMNEFDELPMLRVRKIGWKGGTVSFHLNEEQSENRMHKLWRLCKYFPLKNNEVTRRFVIEKYEELLREDKRCEIVSPDSNEKDIPLSVEERISQIDVITELHPFRSFDPQQTVAEYYKNIRFAKEFISLHSLKALFPEAYHEVVTANVKDVRQKIKDTIYDDIDHHLYEGTHEADEAISELIDMDLEQLMEIYKFKLSKKFMKDINDMAGYELFNIGERKKDNDNVIYEKEEDLKDDASERKKADKQKYKGYQLALKRLLPSWDDNWYQDDAFAYIKTKEGDSIKANLLINRINDNEYYSNLLGSACAVDLLLRYLNTNSEDIAKNSFLFYEQLLRTCNFDVRQVELLQKMAYDFYINDHFTFRKEAFEYRTQKALKENWNWESFNSLIDEQDIWLRFANTSLQVFLAVRYTMSLPDEERIKLYKSFEEDHMHYSRSETFWRFCYEADRDTFCTHFIVPVIHAEINQIDFANEHETVIEFLKKKNFCFEFKFWEEEKEYELDRGSLSADSIEDIGRCFEEWNMDNLFDKVEDCFNLSKITNSALKTYLQKNCPVSEGAYNIDVSKEMGHKEFIKLLKPAGVTQVITAYIDSLKKALSEM